MKKIMSFSLSIFILFSFLASCSANPSAVPDIVLSASLAPTLNTITASPSAIPPTPSPTPEEIGSHYQFQPKVFSSYLEDVFGKTMCDTWFNLVDAVLAGDDYFICPDEDTYYWVIGQFPGLCFPVLEEVICADWGSDSLFREDGKARFLYKVTKEEAAEKIQSFAGQVESILNETLKDDYSDFEKCLALYEYFADHYTYDYDAYEADEYLDYLSSYRVFKEQKGICGELSSAYSYLLMQAGVDAATMSGTRTFDQSSHQWSYVHIGDHNYHIDPTYGLCIEGVLDYFLMDDEQRENTDYSPETFIIAANYAMDHPHKDYVADDDTFRPLWGSSYGGFDHKTHTLTYWKYDDPEEKKLTFDYTGY